MHKAARLRKRSEFLAVQRQGRRWSNSLLILLALPNQRDESRFGFLVGRRVGIAVVRNRVKRRLREIVRGEPVESGWDVLLIARVKSAQAPFGQVQEAVREVLRRGRLRKEPVAGASLREEQP